ncbi:LacI family DNA-binding transcriptional regulator [Glycomyces salinus]|uniref:LacI family DNA-binding transcriptional regulator n=1 Tax=Glycomyces salinus TaxID=980294 RepID=UPI0018EBC92F|nr:LacI family DNA-binding transcriptional regulator [Glycomyces salinus]
MTERQKDSRRPTIREVARLAGVSHQTVSRYLRSREGLRPDTLSRIDEAVRELDYRPNLLARYLNTRRTGRLAIVLPVMVHNPSRIIAGATGAAHEAGFSLEVLSFGGGTDSRTERVLELADSAQVEGILALATIAPSVQERLGNGAAIVVAADFDDEMRTVGELTDAAPVHEMVEHLASLGHRRFYHVAGDLKFASARARKAAYMEAIDRFGVESAGVFDGDWSARSGLEAVRALPESNLPTAVIAGNDTVAVGVLRGADERGLDVPGDLSVTGWDNSEFGQFLKPALTSVEIDLEGVGREGMIRLVRAVSGRDLEPARGPVNRLIWRESTAGPGPR